MAGIFGILNLTRDSFSDGGRWLDPAAAIEHGGRLVAAGAQVVDVGAESTHPDAESVPAAEEMHRLGPVVTALLAAGVVVSVDTCKPEVMREVGAMGVQWLNDVHGFRSDAALAAAAAAPPGLRFVVMHARNRGPRAERRAHGVHGLRGELVEFVASRRAAFAAVGVAAERLVFDPGMGFFLGAEAAPSLHVLRHLPELVAHGVPWLVSVSRKSFLGAVTGAPVAARGGATLAAELWALRAGVAYVRTHDVQALRSAWQVERAIAEAP